jgi:hypothetical protein
LRHGILIVIAVLCLAVLATGLDYGPVSSTANPAQTLTSTESIGTTVSVSMSQPQLVYNGAFTVPSTTGTDLLCEFWTANFTTTSGEYVYGNFTSDNPLNFFIVQQGEYEAWLKAGTCGTTTDSITSQLITTSYAFNAAVPSPGAWLIVLVNASNAKNADGFLVAHLGTVGYTITERMTSTLTATPTTSTTLSLQPATSLSFPQFGPIIGIAGIIIGIAAGLTAIFILTRRKRTENNPEAS